jgi:hypothetical protein
MESLVSHYSLRAVLAGLVLLAAGSAYAETIYRWVDEAGNVHFGGIPPAGVEVTIVDGAAESGGPAAPLQDKADTGGEDAGVSHAEQRRSERAEQRAAAAEKRLALDEQCAKMRKRRAELEPRTSVIYLNEAGEPVRMDDDVRLARLEEAKSYLAANCE